MHNPQRRYSATEHDGVFKQHRPAMPPPRLHQLLVIMSLVCLPDSFVPQETPEKRCRSASTIKGENTSTAIQTGKHRLLHPKGKCCSKETQRGRSNVTHKYACRRKLKMRNPADAAATIKLIKKNMSCSAIHPITAKTPNPNTAMPPAKPSMPSKVIEIHHPDDEQERNHHRGWHR